MFALGGKEVVCAHARVCVYVCEREREREERELCKGHLYLPPLAYKIIPQVFINIFVSRGNKLEPALLAHFENIYLTHLYKSGGVFLIFKS